MKKRTGGRAPKDALLMQGINMLPRDSRGKVMRSPGPVKDCTIIKREYRERKKQEREEAARLAALAVDAGDVPLGEDEVPDIADMTSVYRMVDDLRWVYQNCGKDGKTGRHRLKKLMESDKEFMNMVKELMKIEAALLTARIRKEGDTGGGAGQGFFVVLKGLDTDKELLKSIGDGSIDMKQVQHVLDPSAGKYEAEQQEEKEALPETPKEG